jgi:hypothetical protein
VYSSLSVILQRDSQDKSPAGQYLQLKTGGNLIYTVRNWAGGKLPSVSLNSSTELAVVAADGRLFAFILTVTLEYNAVHGRRTNQTFKIIYKTLRRIED